MGVRRLSHQLYGRSPIRILASAGFSDRNSSLSIGVLYIRPVDPVPPWPARYPGACGLACRSLAGTRARGRGQGRKRDCCGHGHNGEYGPSPNRFRSSLARCRSTCSAARPEQKGAEGAHLYRSARCSAGSPPWIERSSGRLPRARSWRARPGVAGAQAASCAGHGARAWVLAPRKRVRARGRFSSDREEGSSVAHGPVQQRRAVDAEAEACRKPPRLQGRLLRGDPV